MLRPRGARSARAARLAAERRAGAPRAGVPRAAPTGYVGWLTGGIEAPEGGADAGVEGGLPAHDSGAAGTGAAGTGAAGTGEGGGVGEGGAAAPRLIGGMALPVWRPAAARSPHGRPRPSRPRSHSDPRDPGRRPGDDLVEGGHEIGARRAGLRRRVADVRPELGDVAVLGVGDLAGQHLVQDAAQRVDVRATVDGVGLDLLGSDVVGRPHPEARPGQASRRPRTLGQPEVGQVRVRLRGLVGDQDVGRLDVAVHESARVRGVERARDLGQDDAGRLEGQGTAIDHAAQVRPRHEAHGEVEHALLLAAAMDRHDVRVLEGGRQARLGPEARRRVVVLHPLGRDQLQRHGPIQIDVHRLVDDAHAPAIEQSVDPVAGEDGAVLEAWQRRPCLVPLVRHDASSQPMSSSVAPDAPRRPPRCQPPSPEDLNADARPQASGRPRRLARTRDVRGPHAGRHRHPQHFGGRRPRSGAPPRPPHAPVRVRASPSGRRTARPSACAPKRPGPRVPRLRPAHLGGPALAAAGPATDRAAAARGVGGPRDDRRAKPRVARSELRTASSKRR